MQQVLDVHVEHDIHHPNNCHNRPVLPISNFIQIITSKPTKGAYPRSETRVKKYIFRLHISYSLPKPIQEFHHWSLKGY